MMPPTFDDADEQTQDRRREDRWHVGKEIPIAMIAALLIQTGAGISWLSNLSFKIDNAIQQLSEFKADRYTKDDARRDRELVLQIVDAQRQRDAEHDRRIAVLEQAMADERRGPKLNANGYAR